MIFRIKSEDTITCESHIISIRTTVYICKSVFKILSQSV